MVRQLPEARSAMEASRQRVPQVEETPGRDYYLFAVGLIGVLAVWIRPMASSLWLDETGTFWVIQGNLRDVIHRALDFQGQFPLYHAFLWGWSKLAGTSEIALRLPSLFGALLATWLCYRLALRLFGEVTVARLAACIFVLLPPVAFAAADARPYALSLATLLGATLVLLRWMETERPRDGILYVALIALALYLDYLFALALVAHAFLAYRQVRQKGKRGVVAASVAMGALALLMLPTIPHFIDVFGRREAMSLLSVGSVVEVLMWMAPPMLVVAYLVGSFIHLPDEGPTPRTSPLPREVQIFLGLWLVVPPLALYVQGLVTGIGLYAERHFLSSVPALAVLAASAFALLSFRRQRIALVVLAMLFVLSFSTPYHVDSDWQGAAQAANALSDGPGTPVFVYSGFSESTQMDWILDPERSQLFLAPLAAYPVAGRTYPLPFELTDRAKEYAERILVSDTPGADRVILITSEQSMTYDVWLTEQASLFGFTRRGAWEFGFVRLLVFER